MAFTFTTYTIPPSGGTTYAVVGLTDTTVSPNKVISAICLTGDGTNLMPSMDSSARPGYVAPIAGENHLGEMGGNSLSLSVATPNLTISSAYAAGQVLGGPITIANAVRKNGGTATVQCLDIKDKANQKTALDILFFSAALSGGTYTDKTTLVLSAADLAAYLGKISVGVGDYSTIGTLALGHPIFQSPVLQAAGGSTTITAIAVSQGTPTWATTGDLSAVLGLLRD